MAVTTIAGKGGFVQIPGTPAATVAKITDWSLAIDADNYEDTSMGDDWRTFVPGVKGGQGRANGFCVTDQDTNGQQALQNALLNGTSLVIQLQLAAGRGYYEATMNITQMNIAESVKGLATFDCTYVANGSVQHNP